LHNDAGMRNLAILFVVTVAAGCATPRFSVKAPEPIPTTNTLQQQAASRVVALMRVHGEELARCFDEMQMRRSNGPAALNYEVDLQLRDRAVLLLGLKPQDPSSITDQQLEQCITEVLIPWQAEPAEMRLVLSLAVAAQPKAPQQVAQRDVNAYRPPERSGE
jgi:hypothetical protein